MQDHNSNNGTEGGSAPTPAQYVLWHPESDCYMYCHSEDERDILTGNGELVDVTSDPAHCIHAEAQLGPWNPDFNMEEEELLIIKANGEIDQLRMDISSGEDGGRND